MKKLRQQSLKRLNVLWSALLSLLGLASCGAAQMRPERGNIMVKYGIPLTEYHVNGRVVDGHGKPLENVEVRIANVSANPDTTDAKGRFEVTAVRRGSHDSATLICTDLAADRAHETDSVAVPFKTKRAGMDTQASADRVKIVLKK